MHMYQVVSHMHYPNWEHVHINFAIILDQEHRSLKHILY